jgi:hypothetical protein
MVRCAVGMRNCNDRHAKFCKHAGVKTQLACSGAVALIQRYAIQSNLWSLLKFSVHVRT